jgi:hypothetical protein
MMTGDPSQWIGFGNTSQVLALGIVLSLWYVMTVHILGSMQLATRSFVAVSLLALRVTSGAETSGAGFSPHVVRALC